MRFHFYDPAILPPEYNQAVMQEELYKIAQVLLALELPSIIFVPQATAPTRPQEGMIVNADGTNWNPASAGAGLHEYVGGVWKKL